MSAITAPAAGTSSLKQFLDNGFLSTGTLMLVPYIIVFAAFVAYPLLYGLWLGTNPESYRQLFQDPAFSTAAVNTVIFLMVAVNVKFVIAMFLSGFFVTQRPWIKVVLVLFILPWAVQFKIIISSGY